jgi:hypothetical protein
MKIKLKEISFQNITFNRSQLDNGVIHNVKYNGDPLEFQTPKLFLESVVKENNGEYLVLKVMATQACKTFCLKIKQLEEFIGITFKNPVQTVFNEDHLKVKIPCKSSRPLVKIYKNDQLFNYYNIENGMEVICLVALEKVWVNNFNEPSYNLNVKEMMIV